MRVKPKYKHTFKLSYRLMHYDEGFAINGGIASKEKTKFLQANSAEEAKQRLWEYKTETFFHYGKYKITKVEKIK